MPQYKLAHITDLAGIADEDLAQFAKELPTIVATLRMAKAHAQRDGLNLSEQFPHITFDTDLVDEVVLRRPGAEHRFDGAAVQAAERSMAASDEAASTIARARRRP